MYLNVCYFNVLLNKVQEYLYMLQNVISAVQIKQKTNIIKDNKKFFCQCGTVAGETYVSPFEALLRGPLRQPENTVRKAPERGFLYLINKRVVRGYLHLPEI